MKFTTTIRHLPCDPCSVSLRVAQLEVVAPSLYSEKANLVQLKTAHRFINHLKGVASASDCQS